MTKKRRKELLTIIKNARYEIYDADIAEHLAKNKGCVGQFYVYWNRYSSDESWPLYCAITRMDSDGDLHGWSFQHTVDDRVEFSYSANPESPEAEDSGWSNISAAKFESEFIKLIALLKRRMTVTMK